MESKPLYEKNPAAIVEHSGLQLKIYKQIFTEELKINARKLETVEQRRKTISDVEIRRICFGIIKLSVVKVVKTRGKETKNRLSSAIDKYSNKIPNLLI